MAASSDRTVRASVHKSFIALIQGFRLSTSLKVLHKKTVKSLHYHANSQKRPSSLIQSSLMRYRIKQSQQDLDFYLDPCQIVTPNPNTNPNPEKDILNMIAHVLKKIRINTNAKRRFVDYLCQTVVGPQLHMISGCHTCLDQETESRL